MRIRLEHDPAWQWSDKSSRTAATPRRRVLHRNRMWKGNESETQGSVVRLSNPSLGFQGNLRCKMTRVAVIEDHSTTRKMLVELIEAEPGYRCVCACASSREAFVEVPKHRPDVVLMDIHLPDRSGIVCTAKLTEKLPELQVIMVTVYKDMDL